MKTQNLYIKARFLVFFSRVDFIHSDKLLSSLLFEYGFLNIYNLSKCFVFTAQEWLFYIQLLNHKKYLMISNLYKIYLKYLIDSGHFDNDDTYQKSEFNKTCLALWSTSPNINCNNPAPDELMSIKGTCDVEDLPHAAYIPVIRRGDYSKCPYCEHDTKCHFDGTDNGDCTWSETTKQRCFPLAGIHCCNGHGSKCLLNRGSEKLLTRIMETSNGRLCPNIRNLGYKEGIFTGENKNETLYYFGEFPNDPTLQDINNIMDLYNISKESLSDSDFFDMFTYNIPQIMNNSNFYLSYCWLQIYNMIIFDIFEILHNNKWGRVMKKIVNYELNNRLYSSYLLM